MQELIERLLGLMKRPSGAHRVGTARQLSVFRAFFWVAHPFLLAIAPIIHLYSRNMYEADALTALVFASGTVALTTVVLMGAWLWQRNVVKAALIASLFTLLFYAYGWVFDLVMKHEPIKLPYDAWHFVLLLVWLSIVVTVGVVVQHTRRNLRPVSRFLSGTLMIFVIMCLIKIVHHDLRIMFAGKSTGPAVARSSAEPVEYQRVAPSEVDSPDTPDVYYIILDGYARADTLQRVCHYDNSEFISFLRSRGFYVADESCSNYPMTFMSLASSLNMCYLDQELKSPNYGEVYAMWDRASVARVFQSKGYRFVYLATNFKSTLNGTDIVFQRRPAWLLNQFAESLLRTTALRFFEPQMADQHLYQFEKIKQVPQIKGPTFTFCHIIAPHPPYVFDRFGHVCCDVPQSMFFKDGAEQQQNPASEEARQAYAEQVMYVNKRVEETIDSILAQSTIPPIIMIQGDHGTFFTLPAVLNDESLDRFAQERLPILNAYLVPEKMRAKLRPDISPVNSFRLLFNECFGDRFELLPEKHLVGWYYGMQDLRDATPVVHPSAARQASAIAKKSDLSKTIPR